MAEQIKLIFGTVASSALLYENCGTFFLNFVPNSGLRII